MPESSVSADPSYTPSIQIHLSDNVLEKEQEIAQVLGPLHLYQRPRYSSRFLDLI